jgi:hypothetical protein
MKFVRARIDSSHKLTIEPVAELQQSANIQLVCQTMQKWLIEEGGAIEKLHHVRYIVSLFLLTPADSSTWS